MTEALLSTYRGKKVFLTGHTGFKGAWLLQVLKELGASVKGYSLAPDQTPALFDLLQGDSLCESVIADIRDRARLKQELLDFQPDFVFHMAAQALVIDSYREPVETYETNVMGTVNLLDAVRHLEKPCQVVIITTDKVYENKEVPRPYLESDELGGYDPYSNSKACTELATRSYRLSFFHPDRYEEHQKWVATVRSGNVIGGGDWSDNRIVPDLARALRAGEPLNVRNPHAVRPWQHVLEPLGGYLLVGHFLASKGAAYADAFNFGPVAEDALTVGELVKIAIECWGSGSFETPELKGQPHEAGLLMLDINKAKEMLNWSPKFRSREAIQTTIDWYKNFESDPVKTTQDQINAYFGF